jgi:hypothetical protein
VPRLLDLELLHNFSTKTCLSITTHGPLQQFYKTTFITEALKSDCLLQCILSFSAFHLAQQYQETLVTTDEHQQPAIFSKIEEYLRTANAHYIVALSSFRLSLANITAEHSHALFGCTALIVMISFAQSCDSLSVFSSTASKKSSLTVRGWLVLLRGINCVLTETWEWVHTGPMAPILYLRGPTGYDSNIVVKVDEDITAYFDGLSIAFANFAEQISVSLLSSCFKSLLQ